MARLATLITAAVVLPLVAVPASGQSRDDMFALRCILVTGSLAQSEDKEMARNGAIGSLFWLGRLKPALTEKQIERGGGKAAVQLQTMDINAELQKCGDEMARQGEIVERVGKALQEQGLTPTIR